jgi:ubiquinone/menaquinone biosynthesis C-methylase UbiE
MIPRILEPEVMDSPEEARDYDAMDHSTVNEAFARDFLQVFHDGAGNRGVPPGAKGGSILDVGTGTALIPILLAKQDPNCAITAVDMSSEMLKLAADNISVAHLKHRIHLQIADAKALPFADSSFDAVISNSILHHLPEPVGPLREMSRVSRRGGILFVRDLLRPETEESVDHLVKTYAGDETPHARQMFRDSLCAAYTLSEMRQALIAVGLPAEWVTQTSDRHWTIVAQLG